MAKKLAVNVGVNYVGTPNQLSGCVNDARDWAQLLAAQGYETQLVLETQATKAAILAALRNAVSRLGWGDRLVWTYSGHGTWVPDRNGDEVDGRDEAICPVDFQRSGGLLLDDEIQSVFEALPAGASALTLSDSCHSGTVSRFAALTGSAVQATPRFIPPHTILDGLSEARAVAIEENLDPRGPRKTASLISGCADTEYSYDAWFGQRANGAMTRAAVDSWRPGMSLNAWFKAIRAVLPSGQYPQTPQLTASSAYRKYTRAL